jgi:hypothetical protein
MVKGRRDVKYIANTWLLFADWWHYAIAVSCVYPAPSLACTYANASLSCAMQKPYYFFGFKKKQVCGLGCNLEDPIVAKIKKCDIADDKY